ncbi:MAG: hypothetical protein QGF09_13460 [Rhodospirillales bacterium]|nr:hypothetical protein [Rhodospirillales bacterium]
MRKHLLILLILVVALPVLSACGKKSALKYPEGEKTDYPRQYPSK